MKSCETLVAPESDYFVYSPSVFAQEALLYPLYTGHFIYKGGYSLYRDSYDSFLLMYIESGELTLDYEGRSEKVAAGSFLLIDCYKPHAYYTDAGLESIWCHFDGINARALYINIVSRLGNVFSMNSSHSVIYKLTAIYNAFLNNGAVKEPLISKYLTDIMTAFLLYAPINVNMYKHAGMAEEVISYINEHFAENISIDLLAGQANLSKYHFLRTFKGETGFTPHEYIINMRINTAKYLLKNTKLSVKDICYNTGFSCESVFCSAFKKRVGATPVMYRCSNLYS